MDRRSFLYFLAGTSSLLGFRKSFASLPEQSLLNLEKRSSLPISSWVNKYVDMWNSTPSTFPTFINDKINYKQQVKNEARVRKLAFKYENQMGTENFKANIINDGRKVVGDLLNVNLDGMNLLASSGMLNGCADYLEKVQILDKQINAEDIFQAGRNIATAMSLQFLSGNQVGLTSSIYGYSMLYPYTDNLLDEPALSKFEKIQFAQRFGQRLAGEITTFNPNNAYERRIFPMVDYIESQWPRNLYPAVYDSLLAIHDMQLKSLSQQNRLGRHDLNETIRLSIEKGGTSVLADAFLVQGNPDEKFAEFAFAYGVVLQLVDDLEDAKSDLANKSATIITDKINAWQNLDEVTCKLINMWFEIIGKLDSIPGVKSEEMPIVRKLLANGITHFVAAVIANNPQYFSEEFSANFISRSSVTVHALRETNLEKMFLKQFRQNPSKTINTLRSLA